MRTSPKETAALDLMDLSHLVFFEAIFCFIQCTDYHREDLRPFPCFLLHFYNHRQIRASSR